MFGVLQPESHLPETAACLVEVSYITNPPEDRRLARDDYRRQLAAAILNGISDFLSAAAPEGVQLESPSDLPLVPGTEDAAEVALEE
ncbi:N-acetylmuramoyl-L-alanine amidase [Ramlibacter henchirensis]|uniref:N-acetylmuramoyl-L-alanine amidase n=1 Tax=Ramlibacter henchirensis TaxID=204072 RepID=UPI003B8497BF